MFIKMRVDNIIVVSVIFSVACVLGYLLTYYNIKSYDLGLPAHKYEKLGSMMGLVYFISVSSILVSKTIEDIWKATMISVPVTLFLIGCYTKTFVVLGILTPFLLIIFQ